MASVKQLALERFLSMYIPEALRKEISAEFSAIEPIESFDVIEEKFSGTHYLGRYNVKLSRNYISQILQKYGLELPVLKSFSILLIPVWDNLSEQRHLLWEETNFWRQIWDQGSYGDEFHRIILPMGDLDDEAALPFFAPEKPLTAQALLAFKNRYHAERIYAVRLMTGLPRDNQLGTKNAELSQDNPSPQSQPILDIMIQDMIAGQNYRVPLPQGQLSLDTPEPAIRSVLDSLILIDPVQDTPELRRKQRIVVAPCSSKSWEILSNHLSLIPEIDLIFQDAVGMTMRAVTITYHGKIDDILAKISQMGIKVVRDGEHIVLSLS